MAQLYDSQLSAKRAGLVSQSVATVRGYSSTSKTEESGVNRIESTSKVGVNHFRKKPSYLPTPDFPFHRNLRSCL